MDYDIAVIGAGIHGVAVARQAAAEGYSVLLLEQFSSPAQGTSSRSSKLIHGGLRYLESGQFKLVRECLYERNLLLKQLPSLVSLSAFYIPVYQNSPRKSWLVQIGLLLYWILGGGRFRRVARADWHQLDGLKTENLKTVFQYDDAQTDDAALTRVVLDDAVKRGAALMLDARVSAINTADNSITLASGKIINARVVINAAGPWVNQVLRCIEPLQADLDIDLVQGTHIIVNKRLEQGVYYIQAADNRVVFAMPWKGRALIGTTEIEFSGDPAQVKPLQKEIDYLLATWNNNFSDRLSRDDVLDAFAGLRVLPAAETAAFSRSRDTQLIQNGNVISIVGGKLTSHRHTAKRTMSMVHRLIRPQKLVDTAMLDFTEDSLIS